MNNIRQIIEERLDNARNDWLLDKRDYLRGQMVSYRDCLNLFPELRTETDILNDFEMLGYKITSNTNYIRFTDYDKGIEIRIDFECKSYCKYDRDLCELTYEIITMQEHKLLNELFEVWQWI